LLTINAATASRSRTSQQEQAVLQHVAAQARTLGLDERAAQHVFKVQIALAKEVQQTALQNPLDENGIPSWARGLDLNNDLRPVLTELNDRIVRELARAAIHLQDHSLLQRLTDEEVTMGGVSATGKQHLTEALLAVGNGTRQEEHR